MCALAQDTAPIVAVRYHLIINPEPNAIYVSEMYVLSIAEENTPENLHFSLPDGYRDLRVDEDVETDVIVKQKDSFVDERPVEPGMKQILFAYLLPVDEDSTSYDLSLNLEYAVAAMNVLVVDNGVQVDVEQLMPQPARQTDMGSYLHWVGENLAAGTELSISFSDLDKVGTQVSTEIAPDGSHRESAAERTASEPRAMPAPVGLPQEMLRWGALVAAVLGVVGVFVWGEKSGVE